MREMPQEQEQFTNIETTLYGYRRMCRISQQLLTIDNRAELMDMAQNYLTGELSYKAATIHVACRPEPASGVLEYTFDGKMRQVVVPIEFAGERLGSIVIPRTTPSRLRDTQREMLEVFASLLGIAIMNIRRLEEAIVKAKQDLTAAVSQELRSPLNSITGWIALLRRDCLDAPTTKRALDSLERHAKIQAQILDDLLDVAHMTAGDLSLDCRTTNLDELLDLAMDALRPDVEIKSIRIHRTVDPNLPPIWGDPDRLLRVLWNLLGNAVKFTPREGEICIQLECHDDEVQIRMTDTGIGIAQDQLPYIFDQYRHFNDGHTGTSGLGLGLTIVREIVELHGGTVRAESRGLGNGSSFTVKLPVREPSFETT